MFKNKIINEEFATRYIASWLKVGGSFRTGKDINDFHNWLSSMGISIEDAYHISNLATCGKLELQNSARKFLNR